MPQESTRMSVKAPWRVVTCQGSMWAIAVAIVLLLSISLPQTTTAFTHSLTRRGEPSGANDINSVPPAPKSVTYFRNFTMPGASPKVDESYLCVAQRLSEKHEEWVVRFDPLASANRAHHMLLFGCSGVEEQYANGDIWDCMHHGVCQGSRIMYAWAKNAPTTNLPSGVGFRIGGRDTGITYLTLQIHYAKALPEGVKDHSGLQMELTLEKQKYKAGIYLLVASAVTIPPLQPKTYGDINCLLSDSLRMENIHLFAYRVHAHALGSVITGYRFDSTTNEYTEIARGNPHWPQAFYPMNKTYIAKPSDILHARCTWDSTSRNRTTYIGSTAADEMCNLYLMYYTDTKTGEDFGVCGLETYQIITKNLPPDSDKPLPFNPTLEEHAHGENKHQEEAFTYSVPSDQEIKVEKKGHSHKYLQNNTRYQPKTSGYDYEEVSNYPQPQQVHQRWKGIADTPRPALMEVARKGKQLKISAFRTVAKWGQKDVPYGQVVAVALDSQGDVVVFHRGERTWDGSTFTAGNKLRNRKVAIQRPTLLHLKKDTGELLHKWGEKFFFMPHGLTLDKDNNIWVTDIGLHQVFKFPADYGDGKPLLTLGTRFEPGSDDTHLCKPTGVAVMSSGEFFVSDGYCNARVIKYSADGKILLQFGKATQRNFFSLRSSSPAPGTFSIPHALTLADNDAEVCVADRENGRVQCFTTTLGKFARQFKFDAWGNRLFSMSYSPASGGKLFAVNGPAIFGTQEVMVYEVDFTSGELLGAFSPNGEGLSNPHDVVASRDGREVYVAEIGPNKLWKFENSTAAKLEVKDYNISKLIPVPITAEESREAPAKGGPSSLLYITNWSSVGVSTVVLGLLTIPVIVLTILTLIIRAKRTGHVKVHSMNGSLGSLLRHPGKHDKGLNIGSLLNKHHGFEKVATEDLDHDAPDSGDSDIEEFSQIASRA